MFCSNILNNNLSFNVSTNRYGSTTDINTSNSIVREYDIIYCTVATIPTNSALGLSITITLEKII